MKNDGKISLTELFSCFWQARFLFVAVVLASVVLGTVYLFTSKPRYRTSVMLKAYPISFLTQISVMEAPINELKESVKIFQTDISPEEALKRMAEGLESFQNRFYFFKTNKYLFQLEAKRGLSEEQNFIEFNSKYFKLLKPDPKRNISGSDYVGLEIEYSGETNGPVILNEFVKLVHQNEIEKLKNSINYFIAGILNQLENNLKNAINEYEKKRELKICQLDEAIAIAKSLGIKKPTTPSKLGMDNIIVKNNYISAEIVNQNIPSYFMGTDALEAERKVLIDRKPEIIYLESNVFKIKEKIDILKRCKIDYETIKLTEISSPAFQPIEPVKPEKVLVLTLFLMIGLLTGIMIVLIKLIYGYAKSQRFHV